jgi:hypothetical protein
MAAPGLGCRIRAEREGWAVLGARGQGRSGAWWFWRREGSPGVRKQGRRHPATHTTDDGCFGVSAGSS